MGAKYLQHKDIDKEAWDISISQAYNGNLYGYSWYLDIVCPNWDALVSHDYKNIFPLTRNKKFGFSYLFRPLLSQQLGLFSILPQDKEYLQDFLEAIPPKYRLIQYCLNKSNIPPAKYNPVLHKTFELDLSSSYEILKSEYSENHKRNLKKEKKSGCLISEEIGGKEFIRLLLNDTSPGSKILSSKTNILILKKLIDRMLEERSGKIIGKKSGEGKLVSAVLFGYSHKTWYYLVPVNSEEGKAGRALFGIIDFLIGSQAGSEGTLDFEGSDIPGLAKFYSGFGACEVDYSEIRVNKLPWPIKYLK